MEKLKPSALPLLPLVLHPSRPTVVWAPGGEVLAYNESKGWEQPNVCHAAPIRALDAYVDAASPVTRWLSAGDDKMLMTWLEKDGAWELQEKLGHSKKITAAIFDRDGRIIFADRFGDVYRWVADGEPEMLSSHFAIVTALMLTPSGRFLVAGDNHEKVRISHYPQAAAIRSICLGHSMQITALASRICEGEEQVLSASADGTLRLWTLDGEARNSWSFDSPISTLCCEGSDTILGLEAPSLTRLQGEKVTALLPEAPQALRLRKDGGAVWVDRRGHLRLPKAEAWEEVSPGKDFPPSLVVLSKNAGDADDDRQDEEDPKERQASKKKRRE